MKLRVCSRHLACVAGLLGFATFIPGHAFGQINSASASVTLNAILAESLTFSTPSKIIFTLSNNQFVCGNSPVNLTTKRTLAPTRTSVVLYGFFASASAALTDGAPAPDNIPSSGVYGAEGQGSYLPTFTPSRKRRRDSARPAELEPYDQAIGSGNFSGERVDTLGLGIYLPPVGYGLTLPAYWHPHNPEPGYVDMKQTEILLRICRA